MATLSLVRCTTDRVDAAAGDDGIALTNGDSENESTGALLPDLSDDPQQADDSGEGGGSDGANAELGDTMCPDQQLNFTPQIPTVLLLLDQSGSMEQAFDGTTRWDAVERALFDPANGVVASLENEIRFGLALYTSIEGNTMGMACPLLVEAAPELGNYARLRDLYAGQTWLEDTPTGESIAATSAALEDFDEPGQKIIVLATDGEPDTCEVPDPQMGQSESVAAAMASHAAGIDVFVISVGEEISENHLQDMADAGVGRAGAPFYMATDQQAMIDAFRAIIDGVRSCVFELEVELKLDKAHLGTVVVNGEELVFEGADGWQANTPQEIELLGAACEAIQSGTVEIDIEFPCDTFDPPARR